MKQRCSVIIVNVMDQTNAYSFPTPHCQHTHLVLLETCSSFITSSPSDAELDASLNKQFRLNNIQHLSVCTTRTNRTVDLKNIYTLHLSCRKMAHGLIHSLSSLSILPSVIYPLDTHESMQRVLGTDNASHNIPENITLGRERRGGVLSDIIPIIHGTCCSGISIR
jgi:hypothetical protein